MVIDSNKQHLFIKKILITVLIKASLQKLSIRQVNSHKLLNFKSKLLNFKYNGNYMQLFCNICIKYDVWWSPVTEIIALNNISYKL